MAIKMNNWTKDWMTKHSKGYTPLELETAWGRTALLTKNHERTDLEPILFIPGFRTCGIFWDINGNLSSLYDNYRIYLLDVLGQPGLSHYEAPKIRPMDYGLWLAEVIEALGLEQVNVAGVSFGGFLIFKLARANNELIKRAFVCNPVGLMQVRYHWSILFYNVKPYLLRSRASISEFLDKIIINDPALLEGDKREAIIDFIKNTIRYDKLKTQYPYRFSRQELYYLQAETHLILDAEDAFIDQVATEKRGRKLLSNLKGVHHIQNIGHGLEFAEAPIQIIKQVLEGNKK